MYFGFGKRVILSGTEIFEKIQGADYILIEFDSGIFKNFPLNIVLVKTIYHVGFNSIFRFLAVSFIKKVKIIGEHTEKMTESTQTLG